MARYKFNLTEEIFNSLESESLFIHKPLVGKEFYFTEFSCFYSSHCAGQNIYQIGAFSYSWNNHNLNFCSGNYCSIARGFEIRGETHPFERFSTSTITYNPKFPITAGGGVEKVANPHNIHSKMRIGNDVWIGNSALLAPHISIGTGACVAARANVTRDVPPYAIVGGNPAKIIKYRFEEKVIEQLLETHWTEYDIMPMKMKGDIPILEFIELFYDYKEKGLIKPIVLKNLKQILDKLGIEYNLC